MKTFFTLLIVLINSFIATAQWSNTTNLFTDSLAMPVSTANGTQNHVMSITSYPDSGTIVYWEDYRNNNQVDVFAQKYDKTGHALWAINGIPVAAGPNPRHFYSSMNGDYRNYSYAATDSSGGFYISYLDDSSAGGTWQRVVVQHVRNNGSVVFPGVGYIVAAANDLEPLNYSRQQLVADGNKGFFIAYMSIGSSQDIFARCYRDEGGSMRYYGGGQMDVNAFLQPIGGCSNFSLQFRDAYASDFFIYPDLQHGCNVLMTLAENAGPSERTFIGFNKLLRIKKTCTVITGDPMLGTGSFTKDSVKVMYNVSFRTYIFQCGNEVGTGFIMDGNGYLQVTGMALNQYYPKGVVIPTNGNTNINMVASDQRGYNDSTNTVTNYSTLAYYGIDEKYDSIPYCYTVFPFRPEGFHPVFPPGIDKINSGPDTILKGTRNDYEFALALTGNKVFATAVTLPPAGASTRAVLLQQLQMTRQSADSFAVNTTTGNSAGVVIGKEVSTGFGGSDISYETPQVVAGSPGNALFYINEIGRSPRVSPIVNGTELAWGAMGKPIASGRDVHGYYYPTNPIVTLDPLNGSGIISWDDDRGGAAGQQENIYLLHLDSLNLVTYNPPQNGPKPISFGTNLANPVALLGTSHAWTNIDLLSTNPTNISTVVQILDNYNLGAVQTQLYGNTSTIRSTGGVPYLDRNITIIPEHNPLGTADISIRLFFTNAEFAALQAADPSILNPGYLSVIKQPNTTGITPDSYTPVAGEVVINPDAWLAVNGGYYLQITVNSFSNFFIQKGSVVLPVTWLGVQAKWKDDANASITWQVANQQNVKNYTVQYRIDGSGYTDVATVDASTGTSYSCTAPASRNGTNDYRIVQQDLDGKKNYSIVVQLQSATPVTLSAYPNPAKDLLSVTGLNRATEITILDAGGRPIGHTLLTPGSNRINVAPLAKGIYFLRVQTDKQTETMKFMKE